MVHLAVGDYLMDGGVLVERKTYADLAVSLADGRLFPQAARLAQSPHRPMGLIEGPTPIRVPNVHPHALQGAIVSLAVMWRLPVLHADDPEDSLRILQCLARQASRGIGRSSDGTTGSRSVSPRAGSTYSRVCPVSGLRSRIDCWSSSARSSA